MDSHLEKLVNSLPECYQPIFGSPDLSKYSSRKCHDRLKIIEEVVAKQSEHLGHPLRILDLGCAQGFFSFSLAAKGHSVKGVDYLDSNIKVCEYIKKQTNFKNITFEQNSIQNIINTLTPNSFDLVLGLSIFHHITHDIGLEQTKSLISKLSIHIEIGLYEFALASENYYWAKSLPINSRELLSNYKFSTHIADTQTHLGTIKRPFYFASNQFLIMNYNILKIDSYKTSSHIIENGHHKNTRRYYFSGNCLFKQYLDLNDGNIKEYENEVTLLCNPPSNFSVPKLLGYFKSEHESWICRNLIPGTLLVDIIERGDSFDPQKVINEILEQLIILEKNSLYHSDLRTWNVIISENKTAYLLDFGAISKTKEDCYWPNNIFFSFFIFMKDVYKQEISSITPIPAPIQSTDINIKKVLYHFLLIEPEKWSFTLLRKIIQNSNFLDTNNRSNYLIDLLISEIARLDKLHRDNAGNNFLYKQLEQKEFEVIELNKALKESNEQIKHITNSRGWRLIKYLRTIRTIISSHFKP